MVRRYKFCCFVEPRVQFSSSALGLSEGCSSVDSPFRRRFHRFCPLDPAHSPYQVRLGYQHMPILSLFSVAFCLGSFSCRHRLLSGLLVHRPCRPGFITWHPLRSSAWSHHPICFSGHSCHPVFIPVFSVRPFLCSHPLLPVLSARVLRYSHFLFCQLPESRATRSLAV